MMMCRVSGPGPGRCELEPDDPEQRAEFTALLEDDVDDLYENAPCGYLSTLLDGRIAKINTTLLDWLGYQREDLVGRRYFSDLLTVGGALPGEIDEQIALVGGALTALGEGACTGWRGEGGGPQSEGSSDEDMAAGHSVTGRHVGQ